MILLVIRGSLYISHITSHKRDALHQSYYWSQEAGLASVILLVIRDMRYISHITSHKRHALHQSYD